MMKLSTIKLCPTESQATLDCYIADCPKEGVRDALLVIPGGGYGVVCADREGEAIAEAFLPKGFNCFVLTYSVGEMAKFPRPLYEASLAMQYIREHAQELKINPDRVFCVGFSAGGHLAGSLGTMWHKVEEVPYGINKPTGMMLCYPVITADKGVCHEGSFFNLNGQKELSDSERDFYSIEKNVDERTCPAFLLHSADDNAVPVESTIYMARELSKNNICFEAHIFPHSPHGAALSNSLTSEGNPDMENEQMAQWPDLAAKWAKTVK